MNHSSASRAPHWASVPLLLLGLLLGTRGHAQVWPEFGAHLSFNGGDFMTGFQGGFMLTSLDLSFRADFTARVGSKRVLIPASSSPDLFYQYREARYLFGLEVEKRVTIVELGDESYFGVTGIVLGGYTFGDYRGTDLRPYRGATFRTRVAPYFMISSDVILRAGYEYLPSRTEDVSDHRFFFAFNILISE